MISADIQDKDALIKAAWQRWFEADYSWEGLKARPVYGFTSIQDYWRVIPKTGRFRSDIELIASGELITVDGQKTYHLAHLPLLYEDGSTTIKTSDGEATHKRMMSIIYRHLHSTNDHANLDGIVVAGFFDASISEVKNPFRASFSDAFFAKKQISVKPHLTEKPTSLQPPLFQTRIFLIPVSMRMQTSPLPSLWLKLT